MDGVKFELEDIETIQSGDGLSAYNITMYIL